MTATEQTYLDGFTNELQRRLRIFGISSPTRKEVAAITYAAYLLFHEKNSDKDGLNYSRVIARLIARRVAKRCGGIAVVTHDGHGLQIVWSSNYGEDDAPLPLNVPAINSPISRKRREKK